MDQRQTSSVSTSAAGWEKSTDRSILLARKNGGQLRQPSGILFSLTIASAHDAEQGKPKGIDHILDG